MIAGEEAGCPLVSKKPGSQIAKWMGVTNPEYESW
jgi:hypothetical protein